VAALTPTPLPASSVPEMVILMGVRATSTPITSRILSIERPCCSLLRSL